MTILVEELRSRFFDTCNASESAKLWKNLWCHDCQDVLPGECKKHGPLGVIPDNKQLLAYSTLPTMLTIKTVKKGKSKYISANQLIPKGTQFGPLIGPYMKNGESVCLNHEWIIFDTDGPINCIKTEDPALCNWMMFVRKTTDISKVNVIALQHNQCIYFITIKPIPKGTELKYYYSDNYHCLLSKILDEEILEKNPAPNYYLFLETEGADTEIEDDGFQIEKKQENIEVMRKETAEDNTKPLKKRKSVKNEEGSDEDASAENSFFNEILLSPVKNLRPVRSKTTALERDTSKSFEEELEHSDGDDDDDNFEDSSDEDDYDNDDTASNDPDFVADPEDFLGEVQKQIDLDIKKEAEKRMRRQKRFESKNPDESPAWKKDKRFIEYGRVPSWKKRKSRAKDPSELKVRGRPKLVNVICEYCGKEIASGAKYKRHALTHLSPEQRELLSPKSLCSVCGIEFTSAAAMRRHERIHTSEDYKFRCTHCNKGFWDKYHLNRHEVRHSGQHIIHECDICNKKFSSKDHVNRHKLLHYDIRKHQCPVCGKRFTQNCDMLKHKANVHDKEPSPKKDKFCEPFSALASQMGPAQLDATDKFIPINTKRKPQNELEIQPQNVPVITQPEPSGQYQNIAGQQVIIHEFQFNAFDTSPVDPSVPYFHVPPQLDGNMMINFPS